MSTQVPDWVFEERYSKFHRYDYIVLLYLCQKSADGAWSGGLDDIRRYFQGHYADSGRVTKKLESMQRANLIDFEQRKTETGRYLWTIHLKEH